MEAGQAPPPGIAIGHDPARHAFLAHADGHDARLDYVLADGLMTITHTGVPPEIGGRGIGGALVAAALDHARGEGLRVRPRCPFADWWMRQHPGYEDLRA